MCVCVCVCVCVHLILSVEFIAIYDERPFSI